MPVIPGVGVIHIIQFATYSGIPWDYVQTVPNKRSSGVIHTFMSDAAYVNCWVAQMNENSYWMVDNYENGVGVTSVCRAELPYSSAFENYLKEIDKINE